MMDMSVLLFCITFTQRLFLSDHGGNKAIPQLFCAIPTITLRSYLLSTCILQLAATYIHSF